MAGTTSIDALEQELIGCERLIARTRCRQVELLRALDDAGVRQMDGSRSMLDWVAARLDVTRDTARLLTAGATLLAESPDLGAAAADGTISYDRALATARLARAGADEDAVRYSAGLDLQGVRRLTARHRRMRRVDEQAAFRDRFLALRPNLDESSWRVWGDLHGIGGRVVEKAVYQAAADLPDAEGQRSGGARLADALVKIAQDYLDGSFPEGGAAAPLATVFVDGNMAAATEGEAGAEIATGPRVGPAVLEAILCGGRVQVVTTDDGRPITASRAVRAIPPAVRRFVLHRDGGCVVDGCASRYRRQPHHIVPWSEGGTHDADNLATLCWYHHHVIIHGEGYRLDPTTPPQRRRLIRPRAGPDPPPGPTPGSAY